MNTHRTQAREEYRIYLLNLAKSESYDKIESEIQNYEHKFGEDNFIIKLKDKLEVLV